jgi:hypothetical protein
MSDPFATGRTKRPPFAFVLDEIARLEPWTRPMFGCTAVYVEEAIVFILRDKKDADEGVWIATTKTHHASLRALLPSMRSITVFGTGETGWQVLPACAEDFEESVLRACALVVARDPRIGKVPKRKTPKRAASATTTKGPRRPRAK